MCWCGGWCAADLSRSRCNQLQPPLQLLVQLYCYDVRAAPEVKCMGCWMLTRCV